MLSVEYALPISTRPPAGMKSGTPRARHGNACARPFDRAAPASRQRDISGWPESPSRTNRIQAWRKAVVARVGDLGRKVLHERSAHRGLGLANMSRRACHQQWMRGNRLRKSTRADTAQASEADSDRDTVRKP